MSWGDSFVSGFRTGADIRDRKKQRKYEAERDQLERDLRLDLQARQLAAQKALQEGDHTFRAGEGDKDRGFRAGESALDRTHRSTESALDRSHRSSEGVLDRTHRTSEREGGQSFQASQSELDRAARSLALDKELGARALTLDWQKDTKNPANRYYNALADSMQPPDLGGDFSGPLGGAPKLSPRDQAAIEEAKRRLAENPKDATALRVLQMHGLAK